MYKRLLKDASLYSVSSVLARGFSLITVPIFTRILSPADYGALDLLSYFAVLFPMIVGLALNQAVARYYLDAEDTIEKKRIASTVLFYHAFVLVIFIPVAKPAAAYMADEWLAGQVTRNTVLLVFVSIWVRLMYSIAGNQLKYLFLSRKFAYCSIGNTILSTGLSFTFVVFLKWGLFGVFLGQMIGQAVFGLLSLYYGREAYAPIFHWPTLRKCLHYSLPLVPGTVAFYAMQYVDRYAINELKNLGDVGIYGMGARLASLVNLFLMGFQGAWNPTVMKYFKDEGAPDRFKVVFEYYLLVALSILLGLSIFGKEVLLLLTTEAFVEGYVVVPLLVLSAILASIGAYFTYGIQIAEKSSYRLVLNLCVLVINVALNFVLIPKFGIVGAAWATMISFLFLCVAGMMISQRLYYVPYDWPRIFLAVTLASFVANLVLFVDIEVSLVIILAKAAVVMGVIYIVSLLLGARMNRDFLKKISGKEGVDTA